MRNDPIGDVRPTMPRQPPSLPLRAREGRGEPLTRLALLKWLLKLAALLIRSGAEAAAARGAARIGVTGPTRTSRRCAAASERLAPAAADSLWDIG